ncbi:MAG: hypothetical protein EA369_09430 [Bradymonadales bacterium]|nr:MAG: hypothetical protein EA369_09430 [Bradymonadales bacterium]
MTLTLIILSLSFQLGAETEEQVWEPQSLEELDASLLRQRLVAAYGESRAYRNSRWEVSKGGQTQVWTWEAGRFRCPQPEEWNCEDWVPVSFLWWQSRNQWLQRWTNFVRRGFSLDEAGQSLPSGGASFVMNRAFEDDEGGFDENFEAELPPVEIAGRRMALETWEWVSDTGERVKVSSSLRPPYWIERLETANSVEYIEWTRPNTWTRPSIQSLVLDRGGHRVSYRFLPNE